MATSVEYQKLLGRLVNLQGQIGFDRKAEPNEYLKHLHKHFNEREILILKQGNAIPESYLVSNYEKK